MDTAPTATAPADPQAEADRLLAARQAVLKRSQSLWDRAHALQEGTEPPQDEHTEMAADYDHGDATKARYHAEDYDEETAGVLGALLVHIEQTGQIPTAWRKPQPDSADLDQIDRYEASLTVPTGQHVITQQFATTLRLHEGRWVADPGSLSGDGVDGTTEPEHDSGSCPCGQSSDGDEVYAAEKAAAAVPWPTPGQFANAITEALATATAPAVS